MELLLPAGVFVAVFAAALALTGRSPRPVSRLARHHIVAGGAAVAVQQPRTSLLGVERTSAAGALAARLAKQQMRSRTQKLLLEANSSMSVGGYLLIRFAFMFVLAPLSALLMLENGGLTPRGVGMAGFALVVLAILPQTWLKRKARKRARRIEMAMPDALDLLVVCVEGGLSLDGGLQQVARRTEGELANELRRLQSEIGTGMSRREALQALAGRSQSQSLGIFCTTIVQSDKMGISVASTLRTLVETMRTRRRQAAETQARKAPIKMLPFLVVFMIPSLFIVILGPAVLGMMEFFEKNGG